MLTAPKIATLTDAIVRVTRFRLMHSGHAADQPSQIGEYILADTKSVLHCGIGVNINPNFLDNNALLRFTVFRLLLN